MLLEFSTQIVTDLNARQDLLALLDAGAISALISESGDGESFVNYFIKKNPSISKDNAAEWQVVVESWAVNYTASINIADEVASALNDSSNYYDYLTADSEPVRVEQSTYVVTKQIFNIKQ